MIRNRNAYLKNYRFNVIKKSGKKILTFAKRRYYRKPGPKDGWNGMRNRILKYLIKKGMFTVRDVVKYIGLRRQAVYYHLEILIEEELVVRLERGLYVINKYMILSLDFMREKADMLRLEGRSSRSGNLNKGVRIDFLKLANLAVEYYDNFKFEFMTGVFYARGGDKNSNSMDRFVALLEDIGFDIRRHFKRLRLGGRHCPYPIWIYVRREVDVSIFEHRHKFTKGHRFGGYS